MKRVIKTITMLILAMSLEASQPEWFLNIDKANTIVGFGESEKRETAILNARSEIINTLTTNISSKFISSQQTKSGIFNTFKSHTQSDIMSYSQLSINDSKVIKSSKVDNIWYIAVEYSTLPTVQKLSNLINQCDDIISVEPSYLNNTKFGEKLKDLLGFHTKLNIFRKDGLWYIQANDNSSTITSLNRDDMLELFLEQNYSNFKMSNIYKNGDSIQFRYDSSKKFNTLIALEADGKVGVIASNITNNYFPNPSQTIIINNNTDSTIYEMYILISSDKKINTRIFEVTHNKVLDESNFKFDELIYFLDKYQFSSIIVKIRK